jgi:hypothetical protein
MKIKQITINQEKEEIHLDEKEVQEKLEKGEKIFKVNFQEEK